MKKVTIVLLLAVLVFTITACSSVAAWSVESTATSVAESGLVESTVTARDRQQAPETTASPITVEYDQDDLAYTTGASDLSYVRLEGDAITFEGIGAMVDGSIVTITSAGEYSISGTLSDGQIIVDTQDEETVYLVLDGVDITSSTSAPIYVSNAEKP